MRKLKEQGRDMQTLVDDSCIFIEVSRSTQAVTEPTNYTKLSKKIIRQSRRFSKLKPV